MNTARRIALALTLISAGVARAAVFNIPDGDVAALRAAIVTANSNGVADTINLVPGGIYTLTAADNPSNGLPVVNDDVPGVDLTINGHGATIQRAAGAPEFRILQINDAAEVSCNDLTIAGGKLTGTFPANAGGSIFLGHAMLTLTRCSLVDNVGGLGGAIYSDGGSLTVSAGVFQRNMTDAGASGLGAAMGGAIANVGGTLVIDDTVFTANRSEREAGAIYTSGTARLTSSALSENVASGIGGAVANDGDLTLIDCEVTDNQSVSVGGGIHSTKALTLQRCAVNGNQSSSSGGGINNFGALTIESCTFDGNFAGSRGGAVSSFQNDPAVAASATAQNSTFSNNVGIRGGALSNFAASLTLTNCTVSGNTAFVFGGAIHNVNGVVTARAVTFTGNSARQDNAGIFNQRLPAQPGGAALFTIQNSIVRLGLTGVNLLNDSGTIISDGFNLSDDPAGGDGTSGPGGFLNGPTDVRNTDPKLGPLQNNGGPTLTHALLAGSPAIDAGGSTNVPPFDQRGFTRVGAHDIGAFEVNAIPPAVSLVSVVSRKAHGSAANFDVNFPLSGNVGVECRSGGAGGSFQLVFKFTNPLTSVDAAAITDGSGDVGASSGIGIDPHEYIVNASGITNGQKITVTLTNVLDVEGSFSPTVSFTGGFLLGDVNGDGAVNAADATIARNRSGQTTDATNFRADLNHDGAINSADATIVRGRSGSGLEATARQSF